jgi:HK97 family phage portal protein
MKFGSWELRRTETKGAQFEDVLHRLIAAASGGLGSVTPDNCMRSPTVHAIVTAISRRISVSPVYVYEKKTSRGRDSKERLPDHPVARLLRAPNSWQTKTDYWLDASSCFVRHGKFFAYKSRGSTGPIRELIPLHPQAVQIEQDDSTYAVSYRVTTTAGQRDVPASNMHYVRGPARDFLNGDSPVKDVTLAISMEIAAEEFGASFFSNGALPLMMFKYMAGSSGFKTAEAEKQFITDFQSALGGNKRHRAMLLPRGVEAGEPVAIENDKAQFIESRKFQRTVIAGAFGVPPHLVGDLERATFNNVEQQDSDFTSNVIQPVVQAFEAAMERDLLTDEDRRGGVIIRFNLDSILRADFKSRQEGSRIQRDAGVISSNEWREREGMNPIADGDGGDDYMRPANMLVAGDPIPQQPKTSTDNNNAENDSSAGDQKP